MTSLAIAKSTAICEIYNKFKDKFQVGNFSTEQGEKYSPLSRMKPMQEVFIVIQNRCAHADDMYKLCMKTLRQRPSNMNETGSRCCTEDKNSDT